MDQKKKKQPSVKPQKKKEAKPAPPPKKDQRPKPDPLAPSTPAIGENSAKVLNIMFKGPPVPVSMNTSTGPANQPFTTSQHGLITPYHNPIHMRRTVNHFSTSLKLDKPPPF